MGEMNQKRAGWVQEAIDAVEAFRQSHEDGGAYQAVKDLLCDIYHYCDEHDIAIDEVADAAYSLYQGEVEDDE